MNVQLFVTVLGIISLLSGAFLITRSKSLSLNIAHQKDLIDTLMNQREEDRKKIDDLEHQHNENKTKIDELEKQVDTFKNLPLAETAETLKEILITQREILKLLRVK